MCVVLVLAPAPALAATPPSNAEAEAVILRPLSLLKKDDLDFGSLISTAVAGTATLNPYTGVVTTTGGVTPAAGTTQPALFIGAGSRRMPAIIRLPRNPITITRISGTETMTVSDWTLDGNSTRIINANQAFEFRVGARLNIAANQAPGTYVGTFDVTVQYP